MDSKFSEGWIERKIEIKDRASKKERERERGRERRRRRNRTREKERERKGESESREEEVREEDMRRVAKDNYSVQMFGKCRKRVK